MLTRIRLLKSWSYDGNEFAVDQLLEVDENTAKSLVEDGTAELLTKDADGSETKDADKGDTKDADNKGADKAEATVDAATLTALVKAAVAEVQDGQKAARPHVTVVKDHFEDDPTFGYGKGCRGLGSFLSDVMAAESGGPPPKLQKAQKAAKGLLQKAVGSDELTTVEGALGDYLIPPDYHAELLQKPMEPEFIRANGAMTVPVVGASAIFNAEVDENRQTALFGGPITVYRDKELTTLTSSRPSFGQIQLTPAPLTGIAYATNYQLHHTPSLANILASQFQRAWVRKETKEFLQGGGGGESMGILNATCTYSQAKETGQVAATITTNNVLDMWSRCYQPESAIWMASMSCFTALNTLTIDVGTGGAPVRLFDISKGAPATLLGRPLYFTEFCKTLGTVGDLMLANWNPYLIGESSYNEQDTSIHVRFESAQTAFRFVKYMMAEPWWRTTLTLDNGWEVAPFVTLATRA
jgi:HK97 family phage major capsid protein